MDHLIGQQLGNHNLIVWSSVIGLMIIIGIGVFKTNKGEAVFFYNYWDLFLNLIPLVAFIAGFCNSHKVWSSYALIFSPIIAIVYNYSIAFKLNGFFLGLCIGTGRIVLGYIIPALIIIIYITGSPDRRSRESEDGYQIRRGIEKIEKLATIGGLMFFLHKLVGHSAISLREESKNGARKVDVIQKYPKIEKAKEDLDESNSNAKTPMVEEGYDPFSDPVRLALNNPEVLPCISDVTIEFWIKRLQFWGKPKIQYTDPYGKRSNVSIEDFRRAMTEPEEIVREYGKWTMDKRSVKSFTASRESYDATGRKRKEMYFVDITLHKDLDDAFKGKF